MSICENNIDIDCTTCFEVSRADNDLNFIYGLTPSTQYYLWIIDKFRTNYRVLITSGVDGSFDITLTDYPSGMFNKYAGDFEVFLSTDIDGLNLVTMTIATVSYTCLVLSISASTEISCDPNPIDTCSPAYITNSDGSTIVEVPSGDAFSCTPCTPPITKSGIAYQRVQLTGQILEYETYDDGWQFLNGTYNYTDVPYPISFAKLDTAHATPFLMLVPDNAFGNKFRFTDENGLQVYGNDYVVDNLTGLGWKKTNLGVALWAAHIAAARAYTDPLSNSDYRVPNKHEKLSLIDSSGLGSRNCLNYAPFNQALTGTFGCSTSSTAFQSTKYYKVNPIYGEIGYNNNKSNVACYIYYVRNHF